MKITLDDIESFVAIAELGSFNRAAEELNVTQSALSRRIKKLEDVLGVQLLDRTTRQVEMSIMGHTFLPEAKHLINSFDKSISDMQELAKMRVGSVFLSTNMSIADTILPEIVAEFRQEYPAVRLRIHESTSSQAIDKVIHRESEFALVQFIDGYPDIHFETLTNDTFNLVCHPQHDLAKQQNVRWRDLEPYNIMHLRLLSASNHVLKQALGQQAAYIFGDIQVEYSSTLLGLISKNIGVSVIPTIAGLKAPEFNLVTKPILDPQVSRKVGIVTLKNRSLSPAGQAFCNICRQKLKALGAVIDT